MSSLINVQQYLHDLTLYGLYLVRKFHLERQRRWNHTTRRELTLLLSVYGIYMVFTWLRLTNYWKSKTKIRDNIIQELQISNRYIFVIIKKVLGRGVIYLLLEKYIYKISGSCNLSSTSHRPTLLKCC